MQVRRAMRGQIAARPRSLGAMYAAHPERYRAALLDWLACAVGGAREPAARAAAAAADGLSGRVVALGDAGGARRAAGLALLRSGGLRSAFGSDGKALQVGLAAASGVVAAELVAAGATIDLNGVLGEAAGWRAAFGAPRANLGADARAAI